MAVNFIGGGNRSWSTRKKHWTVASHW